jgi:hypothetical protein
MCNISSLITYAQKTKTVTVTGSAILSSGMTMDEGYTQAKNDAFQKAIESVAGIQVQAETRRIVGEAKNKDTEYSSFDQFSQLSRTVSYGKVVSNRLIKSDVHSEQLASGESVVKVEVIYECEIAIETGTPDPSFTLSLNINKPIFYDENEKENEIEVTLECSQNAFVTIFSVSGDTARLLYPNELLTKNKIEAAKKLSYPGEAGKAAGISMVAALSKGKNKDTEMIFAIATKDPIGFKTNLVEKIPGYLPVYKATFEELMRWLLKITPDRRTEAHIVYEIRKKEKRK